MKEVYSIGKESKRSRNKEHITCILTKGHSITIPKLIRGKLSFISGDEITISLKSEELIIQKSYRDMLENKIILNDRGSIKIPQEFIKILSLKKGDRFNLYMVNSRVVLLKKAKA